MRLLGELIRCLVAIRPQSPHRTGTGNFAHITALSVLPITSCDPVWWVTGAAARANETSPGLRARRLRRAMGLRPRPLVLVFTVAHWPGEKGNPAKGGNLLALNGPSAGGPGCWARQAGRAEDPTLLLRSVEPRKEGRDGRANSDDFSLVTLDRHGRGRLTAHIFTVQHQLEDGIRGARHGNVAKARRHEIVG